MPEVLEHIQTSENWKNAPYVGWYRLLRGTHNEGNVVYRAGDEFQSKSHLENLNQPPYSIKFEKIDRPVETASKPPSSKPADFIEPGNPDKPKGVKQDVEAGFTKEELSELTRKDLVLLGEEEGFEFDNKKTKEEMISILLGETKV